jgi:hypothetical protein
VLQGPMPISAAGVPATWFREEDVAPGLLFIALASFALLTPVQNDTWWHLRSGQQMWQTGAFLAAEPFSHTSYGSELHNHWWLTQVVFFAVYSLGGPFLLTAFAGGCAFASVFGSWRLMRGSCEVRVALLAGTMLVSAPGWSIRPQVVSLAFIVLMAHVVVRNKLAWLPAICVLWANSHALVIFGVVMSGTLVIEALVWSRHELRRSVSVAALCVAAPIVSPIGIDYWPQVLTTVSMSKGLQLQEYRVPLTTADLPFWIAAATLIGLTIARWHTLLQRPRSERALLIAALVLMVAAITAARNAAVFAVIAAPVMSRLWPNVGAPRHRHNPHVHPAAFVLVASAVLTAGAIVATSWFGGRALQSWQPISHDAIEAIRTCPDPTFNRLEDGGYLMWTLPARKVFVDSRMEAYPLDVLRESRAADLYGEYHATFRKHGINCALVEAGSSLYRRLTADPSMALTFSDRERAVFVRPVLAHTNAAAE